MPQEEKSKETLIIIDGNALIHRAYHALPPLTTKKGELVNAVYGFLLVFLKAIKDFNPDYVVATFDLAAPTFRHKEYKEYKATRPKAPDELYSQIPKVKEVLGAFNIPVFEKEGFEADDVIGAIAQVAPKKQVLPEIETIILSGDQDILQLVDKNTKVFVPKKGIKDTILYDEKTVVEKLGIKPNQLPDFKGLKGDPSDNIPGVPGIGEKTAASLIKEFGSLEDLYKEIESPSGPKFQIVDRVKDKLLQNKEIAFFSKKLATIRKDVPIDFNFKDCQFGEYDQEKLEELLKKFEFFSLISRLKSDQVIRRVAPSNDRGEIQNPMPTGRQAKSETNSNLQILNSKQDVEILEEIEKAYQEGIFSKEIYELEKDLVSVIEQMEKNGIKIDLGRFEKISRELAFNIQDLEFKIHKLADSQFNINSSQQLSKILFQKLNLPQAGLKKTPKGVISTSAPELEKLRDKHPIIPLIQEYRELVKLKTGFVDALPKLVAKDGRIHPHFHQLGTTTGRFSCSEPNLQNIPARSKWGKEIRRAFITEKGYKLVSFDYSQMELRVAAHIAQDEKMIEAFKHGEDIHKLTAAEINNVSIEKVTSEMRFLAKTLNFGLLYGMGARSFAQSAGISFGEAKDFIKEYINDFKGVAKYVEAIKEKVRRDGYVETLLGRKRFIPEINSEDFRFHAAAERMAINMPIQGSSADIIKMAMVSIGKALSAWRISSDVGKERPAPSAQRPARLLLQIHDELLFEIKEEEAKERAKTIKDIAENVYKLNVPLKVDVSVGDNWGYMEGLDGV